MKTFLDDDFLLESDVASDLYHRVAKGLPIIDYHCHLSPEQMASDHRFRSITDPTIGNHEYSYDAQASGYFNYWDSNKHYYSFNAGGWHFISLDSTSQFAATSGWEVPRDSGPAAVCTTPKPASTPST